MADPVLLLHGQPGSASDWGGVISAIGDRAPAVALDRPGWDATSRASDLAGNAAAAIAVDVNGNAYVVGGTTSTDFPVLNPAFNVPGGKMDSYLAKYDPTGTKVFATYLGGIDDEMARGVAVDGSGNAYVAGATLSGNFPSTTGAFQPNCAPDFNNQCSGDAFVTKFNSSGALQYSTYLGGGSGQEGATGIAVDSAGNV